MIYSDNHNRHVVEITCKNCRHTHIFNISTIESEIKRMRLSNFEIMVCPKCNRKYTLDDFEIALGYKSTPVQNYDMEDPAKDTVVQTFSLEGKDTGSKKLFDVREEHLNRLNIPENVKNEMREEWLKADEQVARFVEEKKKMQDGLPYDKKIVGNMEMEDGTPGDRNCVVILKKEAELYANTYLALNYIVKIISAFILVITGALFGVFQFIISIINKINWCIACSIARMGYFIGYISTIIYAIISLLVFNEPLLKSIYTLSSPLIELPNMINYIMWDAVIISIFTIPLIFQSIWINSSHGRWAKFISKHIKEVTKK